MPTNTEIWSLEKKEKKIQSLQEQKKRYTKLCLQKNKNKTKQKQKQKTETKYGGNYISDYWGVFTNELP